MHHIPQAYGVLIVQIKMSDKSFPSVLTLFAHLSPHALHNVLGPPGPRRIIGVDFELVLQCVHLRGELNKI